MFPDIDESAEEAREAGYERPDRDVMDAIAERQWAETMADLDRDWRL